MIWQREGLGYTYGEISVNLGVDASTVQRTVTRLKILEVCINVLRAARKLTPIAQFHKIQKELQVSLLLEVSLSMLCKFLHTSG
jgi:hypothetical protein